MDEEKERRRKRINLYKKIIIFTVIALILLPTILCIILFIRLNSLNQQILKLKRDSEQRTAQTELADQTDRTDIPVKEGPTGSVSVDTTPKIPEQTEAMTEAATEAATEAIMPEPDEQELVAQALAEGRKVVYLTFDDGPSANTGQLLDVLDSYGVKATFFVNFHEGHEADYQRIIEEGHTLAMHSYTHDYASVYKSVDDFISEVVLLQDYLYDLTGYQSTIFRFPGGSSNRQTKIPIQNYIAYLDDVDITYFDWNVSSGDGSLGLSKQDVYNNVMNGIAKMDISVVLMHDAVNKSSTLEAVPDIIEALQAMNALILPITMTTTPVQHNIN